MTVYASAYGSRPSSGSRPLAKRRASKPHASAMLEDAKLLADQMWEDANAFAGMMRGEVPDDTMEIDEHDTWLILETVAATMSPANWTDPNALEDLFDLRKKFAQHESPELKVLAQQARRIERVTPDPSITPANPEFDKMMRRLKRSDAA